MAIVPRQQAIQLFVRSKDPVPDASFYRNRARDCRDLAHRMTDERGGTGLIELARTYDWQAECLEMTKTLLGRNGIFRQD